MPQFYDFLMSFCNIRNWSHSISILPHWTELGTFWKETEYFFSAFLIINLFEEKTVTTNGNDNWDKLISLTL